MSLIRRGKKKGEEGYGQGKASIAEGDDVLLDEERMVEHLMSCIEAPDYRPPTLPAVAVELMQLSQRADVEIDDVVKLLEQDSLIAGRVLKIVGSAAMAGAVKITSLREATMRMGLLRIRDIVMEIAMNMRVFKSEDYGDTMELLRRHATVTAHLSRAVCKFTPIEAEFAFLAGLLHDVGIAGTLLALADRKGKRKSPPDLISIWPAVDRVHQRAGEIMATHWELPHDIRFALSAHHQVMLQGHPHPLAATVAIANELAHELGAGVIPKAGQALSELTEEEADCVRAHTSVDRSGDKTLVHAREALSIDDKTMERVREEAEQVMETLSVEG
ncbi:MAG: HDOD domain-containing protein [Spirochaetaceae bacterium]|nr:HDOD domain-containing protein [Myxococcales bacterium]MCB9723578.1 HDOD domain-containing protein [Spirochaetaceae bacterium]HPG24903.1 HDOD domain-containing protein [Myxococcota bacterium]